MKTCANPNCRQPLDDNAQFCPNCGMPCSGQSAPNFMQPDPFDHTAEFDPADISENKVVAMMPYLIGAIGIIVALLSIRESRYIAFHVKQALKLTVVSTLVGLLSGLLCWTIIVPIAGAVCMLILFVLKIIAFFQVCGGKAKEPSIIRSLGFLR